MQTEINQNYTRSIKICFYDKQSSHRLLFIILIGSQKQNIRKIARSAVSSLSFSMRNARRPNIFRITHNAFGFHLAWRIEYSQCAIPKIHQTVCTLLCRDTLVLKYARIPFGNPFTHRNGRTPHIVSLREKRFNFTDTPIHWLYL